MQHVFRRDGMSAWRSLLAVVASTSLAAFSAPTSSFAAGAAAAVTMHPALGSGSTRVEVGRAGSKSFPCQAVNAPVRCYSPAQLESAYGWDAIDHRGEGQTVVLVDAFQSPTLLADLDLEDSTFGLRTVSLTVVAPQGLTAFDQANMDMIEWSAEISLDVETVHAYAPGARIVLDLARSDSAADLLAATRYAIEDDLGGVVEMSYWQNESCLPASFLAQEHGLFQRAVRLGISLIAPSGDFGSAQVSCSGQTLVRGVATPADDPDVTGVGGSNLFLSKMGAWTGEVAWSDGSGESGGGVSKRYPAPSYQQPLDAPGRLVPDVSYDAGVDGGVIIVWGSSGEGPGMFFDLGGTSAGTAAWAAVAAVADQRAGARIGLLNPRLYQLGESKKYASYFYDITIGDNIEGGLGGYATMTGFDLVTGWGTPKMAGLTPALAQVKGIAR